MSNVATVEPVVLTSMSGSVNVPGIVHDLKNAAWQYDLRRTPTSQLPLPLDDDGDWLLSERIEPLRPNVARVVATVLGLWVHYGPNLCRPHLGEHAAECWHRENRVFSSDSALARFTTGRKGGAQVESTRDALKAAAKYNAHIIYWTGDGYEEDDIHLLSVRRQVTHSDPDARLQIRLDPFIHDAMMAGRYQSIPLPIVHLKGSDFLLWEQTLAHHRTAKLRKEGDVAEISVGGPRSSIPFSRIGLGRTRPDKRQDLILRGIERGNQAQDAWELDLDRTSGRLVVRRGRGVKRDEGCNPGREGCNSGQEGCNSGRESCSIHAVDRTKRPDRRPDAPSPSAIALREDLDVLTAAWRRAPSEKQVNLIDIIRKQRRMSIEEAAAAFREAIANNVDPIDHLRVRRKPPRPIRTIEDIIEEEPPPLREHAA